MAGTNGFGRSDLPDLRQELALAAHLASKKYDPRRADPVTFYNTVIDNKAVDLVRRQTCRKRDRRRERTIDTGFDHHVHHDPWPASEAQIDVRWALAGLSPDDRDLAIALAEHSVMDLARRTGQSRERVRGARRRIRQGLAERGLP